MSVPVKPALFCSILVLTLCHCAAYRSGLRCGDEFRIETHEGEVFQGRLRVNDGDSLTLGYAARRSLLMRSVGPHTIALSDVASVSRVERHTNTGALMGLAAGALIGYYLGSTAPERECGWLRCRVPNEVPTTIGGAIVGGVVGGFVGHRARGLYEIHLEALPRCRAPVLR
jgi:hypothetical protein